MLGGLIEAKKIEGGNLKKCQITSLSNMAQTLHVYQNEIISK